jgi:periplasmic protein TonB
MARDLFASLTTPHPRRRSTPVGLLSVAFHTLLLAALIVIPILASDELPAPRDFMAVWLPSVPPVPVEPPPASPVARRGAAPPVADTASIPFEAPSGIRREDGIERPLVALAADPTATVGSSVVAGLDLPGVVEALPEPPRVVAPYRTGGVIQQPRRITDVAPVYPMPARLTRVEGVVIIEAIISTTGEVQDARILKSVPLLDQAALAAVRQWRYTPSLLNGIPVPVVFTVTVVFKLQ